MTIDPERKATGRSETTTSSFVGHTAGMPALPKPTPARVLGRRWNNAMLRLAATSASATIVGAIVLMGLFLLIRAVPSLTANEANFIVSSEFVTTDPDNLRFGIAGLFQVTVLSSIVALVIAVPVALGVATFLTSFVPRPLARPLAVLVDLLAAVPSIVFGVWGIFVLAPYLEPVQTFLNENLGWFFLFADGNVSLAGGGTIFTAGVVLAVMILPIIAAVTREAFSVTPRAQIEAAQALGATKWEVVRMSVYPFGRTGLIAGSMLGLGRALGETVAVLIILRTAAQPGQWSLFDGGHTFASKIASAAAEFSAPLPAGAYIAAGFVLFALTFVVNALARMVFSERRGAR